MEQKYSIIIGIAVIDENGQIFFTYSGNGREESSTDFHAIEKIAYELRNGAEQKIRELK